MSARFPFGLRLDDGTSPIFGGARRRIRPTRDKATIRFNYPPLEALPTVEPPPPAETTPEPVPPPPTFSEEELASAVEAARREGHTAAEAKGRAAMLASLEHRQAEALAAIGERLTASQDAFDHMLAARAGASRDLALAVARVLVAKALARQPLADIEAMFREVVVRLEGMPWLELRLPSSLAAAGQAALARVAEEADYRGELRVIPDARLGPGDARLTWQDGAAERDLARLEAQVTALVEAWLPAAGGQAGRAGPTAVGGAGTEARPPELTPTAQAQEPPAAAEPAPPSVDLDDARTDGFE
jgi:flagellar assembly protein FliH